MESHGPKPTINNVARSPTAVPPNGKASRSSSRAFLLLLPLIVLPCVVQLAYTDFWMHAAAGRWILENRAIPHQNIFTYTAREHPFIDHTWLSQVVLYLCWLIGEVPAVRIFQIALVVLSFATLWRFWIRQGAPASLGLVVFSTAIFVSAPRFSPRPELFAAVGIALYLTHLYEFAQARRRHLWWLTEECSQVSSSSLRSCADRRWMRFASAPNDAPLAAPTPRVVERARRACDISLR